MLEHNTVEYIINPIVADNSANKEETQFKLPKFDATLQNTDVLR